MVKETDNILDTEIPVLGNLTYREVHAFQLGFLTGVLPFRLFGVSRFSQIDEEEHYGLSGFVIGSYLKIGMFLVLGSILA